MNKLFAHIRWRLVGWNTLVLGLVLLVLGGAVYFAVSQSLLNEVDRTLLAQSESAIPVLFPPRAADEPNGGGRGPGGPRRGPEGYRGGVFFLAIQADGSVLANPQQVNTGTLTWPQTADPTFSTIQLGDGELARVVLRRTYDGGLLVVGESLRAQETALRTLLIVLVAGGGIGFLLSLAAAWFLSGRALVPIQQAFQRQQEFVADASHELRTPLTVLRSATDLLNRHRGQTIDTNGELFDDVRAEIARMERLAQDLLVLARSDSGGLELMTAPLELDAIAAEVVRRTTPLAQSQGIRLSLHVDPEPVTVDADPDRLQQVLYILIDNSVKHTQAGGAIDVTVGKRGHTAQIEVADTGSGIAAEHLPRIFDRFYRADKARARQQGGTGLGLSIAKMLIDAHEGQLQVASTVGVGTQVTISLPVIHPPARLSGRFGELTAHLPRTASRQ